MKKVLLTAAAVSVLATSSAYAMENNVYLKANAGWSKFNKIKVEKDDDLGFPGTKLKSNNDVHVGVGLGYKVQDNIRVDLMYDHYVNPTYKASINTSQQVAGAPAGVIENVKANAKTKVNINTLLLNGYVDIFNIDSVKVFIGAGLGMGFISSKSTLSIEGNVTQGGAVLDQGKISSSGKNKNKIHAAFAGYLGAGYEFTQGVTGELSYSFRRLGALAKKNEGTILGHHVTAGVRFDI